MARPKPQRRRRRRQGYQTALVIVVLLAGVFLLMTFVVLPRRVDGDGVELEEGRSGAIASAWSGGCFGSQEARAVGDGRGGTGLLKNIAGTNNLAPQQLREGRCGGRKVVAFAITLTKDGPFMDGAAVLAASIDRACGKSEFLCDLVAFLNDKVGVPAEDALRRLGFRVMRPGLPLELDEIEDEFTRTRISKGGCCGPAELMKFFAYTLTEYHRVVHLDTDVLVLQPLDPILDADNSLLYTTDVNMANLKSSVLPVQGGFLVVRPDLSVFDDLVEQVVKRTRFTGKGWGGTNIGVFWGGINVQGLLPYYYEHVALKNNTYRALDRCTYNNMVDTPECREISLEEIRSVHFTNCQKPWSCVRTIHPLCEKLFEQWFHIRREVRV
ncbi:unnamed protein product, partial [Ascophyllum nodosum]